MLEELHVRDLALIEEVWLNFGPGMTALTGETGAGKTALLGALKLLLGERADSQDVRAGAAEALVEGVFAHDGGELIAKRRVTADGRSRCAIDGEMATVSLLSQTVGPLVELHGQHDHQALLSASTHVGYLDRWAADSIAEPLARYRDALRVWREAVDRRRVIEQRIQSARSDADYLRFVLAEIDRVDPKPGEDAQLEARLPSLQHAERLREAADAAVVALRADGGAFDHIAQASAALHRVAGIDPALDSIAERLAELEALADDVGSAVRSHRDSVEADPDALQAVHSRLAELAAVTKKYGPTLADVITRREDTHAALAVADEGDEALERAQGEVDAAFGALEESAHALTQARGAVAPGFTEALARATDDLAMRGASFDVAFAELPCSEWGDDGPHRVEFLYSPAPGQPARPLARIASGGELSRVMLALKGVLGAADRVQTLVFDEIDAGIGGATALSVGRRLKELAGEHQVIVVTHLAQVAAFADHQLVVSKELRDDAVATNVRTVEGDERVAEIARMLSGNDSDASRVHAAELITQAGE